MKSLSALDYVTIAGYFLAIFAIGTSFHRRKSTAKDYFLGGRSMTWLPTGISIVAANLSAISVIGVPAWSYKYDLQLFTATFGYLLVAPIAVAVFLPFYARQNLSTAYEYLERRFNLSVRLFGSLLFQALRCWHVSISLYSASLVIQTITGMAEWQSILLIGMVTTAYTATGGLKAVIYTDLLQFLTLAGAMTVIAAVAVSHVPGGVGGVFTTGEQAGKFKMWNASLDPTQTTSTWACLIGGSTISLMGLVSDQVVIQRLFSTRSVADLRQTIYLQAALVVPVVLSLYLLGIVLFAFYKFNPAKLVGLGNADRILPFFAVRELPAGASGLLIAAIFAASMAVMSAGINAISTAFTVDCYQRLFRPGMTPEHYGAAGKTAAVVFGLLSTFLGLFAGKLGDLAVAVTRIGSAVSGPILGVFLLGTLTRRANAAGCLTGAIVGSLTVAWVFLQTKWSFFLYAPVGVSVTVAVGYCASLLGKPPDRESLAFALVGHKVA